MVLKYNKIYLADCLDIIEKIEPNSIDLAILDPPYNIYAASWDRIKNYFDWLANIIIKVEESLKSNGSLYVWGTTKNNDFIRTKLWMDETLKKIAFKNWIVWIHEVKIHKKLKDRYLSKHEDLLFYAGNGNTFNIIRDEPPAFQLKMHKGKYDNNYFIERSKLPPSQQKIFKTGLQLGSPAKSWWKGPSNQSAKKKYRKFAGYKSEWVCERIINVSSNIGDLILIPFAGSGTECFCAKKLGRNFIASEINEEYQKVADERVNSILF